MSFEYNPADEEVEPSADQIIYYFENAGGPSQWNHIAMGLVVGEVKSLRARIVQLTAEPATPQPSDVDRGIVEDVIGVLGYSPGVITPGMLEAVATRLQPGRAQAAKDRAELERLRKMESEVQAVYDEFREASTDAEQEIKDLQQKLAAAEARVRELETALWSVRDEADRHANLLMPRTRVGQPATAGTEGG